MHIIMFTANVNNLYEVYFRLITYRRVIFRLNTCRRVTIYMIRKARGFFYLLRRCQSAYRIHLVIDRHRCHPTP